MAGEGEVIFSLKSRRTFPKLLSRRNTAALLRSWRCCGAEVNSQAGCLLLGPLHLRSLLTLWGTPGFTLRTNWCWGRNMFGKLKRDTPSPLQVWGDCKKKKNKNKITRTTEKKLILWEFFSLMLVLLLRLWGGFLFWDFPYSLKEWGSYFSGC